MPISQSLCLAVVTYFLECFRLRIMSEEEGDYIRGAIQRLLPNLVDTIDLKRLATHLFSETLITPQQQKTLRKDDWEPLLEMVIEKEIAVDGFMEVLKSQYPQQHQAILEAVEKFRTGEWNLPGKLDIKSELHVFHYNNL